jgi:tetratricopeptide (TPR) repeat protein
LLYCKPMPLRTDLKIFIASSSELNDEREESLKVIVEINKHFPHLHIEPVLFELDTPSGNTPGEKRIQDGINPLLSRSDIVIVLFYSKIGEFTKEEFDIAKKEGKKIFLYLKEGFQPNSSDEALKYAEVHKLKEEVEKASEIRYDKFATLKDFSGILYKDLNKYIGDTHPIVDRASSKTDLISYNYPENKLADYPKPNNLFTGRKKELNEFRKVFTSFRIFAIEGLGGTGKTEFSAKCIEETLVDKNRVIWLNGSSQSNFDVFVENAGYGDVLKREKKTDFAFYSGLKNLIEKDERIIFWDNYNDYEDPAFSAFLGFAQQYLRKATIILITKTDPLIEGITSVPIIKLEGLNNDGIEYAKKIKATNAQYSFIVDDDLEKICRGVEGHPLAIEFSMLLMGYGKSVDDIMLHMPEFSGIRKVEEFSKRLFFDILDHQSTSSEERECFLNCSVFKGKFKGDEINFIHNNKDVFHLLVGLINKLLLSYKEGFYEIHPLVRSFSYEKLLDKKNIHKRAADYFITQREGKLNPSLEEKVFYHLAEAEEWQLIANSIETIGEDLVQQGQLGLANEFMNKLKKLNISRPIFEILHGDIAQIKAEWDKAIIHFEKASQNTENSIVKAQGIIRYGEILYRRGNTKEAIQYFERAYEFSKTYLLQKEEARALNDIALVDLDIDKLDSAKERFFLALEIRHKIVDKQGQASTYNNIGNIFSRKHQYEKAVEYYTKSIEIAKEINNKTELNLYIMNAAESLRKLGKLDDAMIKILQALKISEDMEDRVGIGFCLNTIGGILLRQGKQNEALLKYQESLSIKEEVGDKRGMGGSLCNIGVILLEKKNYKDALYNFYLATSILKQTGIKSEEKNVKEWITTLINEIGKEKFKELSDDICIELSPEIRKDIQPKDFLNEPIVRDFPKVGRNDLCTCGSGKKYKLCHGKSL